MQAREAKPHGIRTKVFGLWSKMPALCPPWHVHGPIQAPHRKQSLHNALYCRLFPTGSVLSQPLVQTRKPAATPIIHKWRREPSPVFQKGEGWNRESDLDSPHFAVG